MWDRIDTDRQTHTQSYCRSPSALRAVGLENCWTFIDNKAVTFILSGGSRILGLQKLSLEIFLALRKFRIFLVLGYQEKTKLSFG